MEKAYLITENTNFENLKKTTHLYDRFYFWDAYCEHNLLYFLKNEDFIKKIFAFKKPLTLTTPIISEKNIHALKNFISKIKDIDWFEIVVNEYWVLNMIKNNFPKIKIIFWNFLSGQNKDPYLKVFKDKEVHKYIMIDNDFYFSYLQEKNINTIEIYNTFQWFELKKDYNISLYYPYIIYSINRYCATFLLHKNKKCFTIVEDCSWCKWKTIKNMDMVLKMKTDNSKNFFRWNKQFYENQDLMENPKIKRIIYNYDLIW